jgi:hypothetical protein
MAFGDPIIAHIVMAYLGELPQPDDKPAEIGVHHQADLKAFQFQDRAFVVGEPDKPRADADRGARAGRAIDTRNVGWPEDVKHAPTQSRM